MELLVTSLQGCLYREGVIELSLGQGGSTQLLKEGAPRGSLLTNKTAIVSLLSYYLFSVCVWRLATFWLFD